MITKCKIYLSLKDEIQSLHFLSEKQDAYGLLLCHYTSLILNTTVSLQITLIGKHFYRRNH